MPQETYYYKFPDGSVSARTVESDGDVIVTLVPPEGAVVIEATTYEELLHALQDATSQLVDTLCAAEQQQTAEDFRALIAIGIPPMTARRLSGYEDDDWAVTLPVPGTGNVDLP